jgi:hypothetical protein
MPFDQCKKEVVEKDGGRICGKHLKLERELERKARKVEKDRTGKVDEDQA